MGAITPYLIPTLIFAGGVVGDLRSRKIRNPWIMAFALLAVTTSFILSSWAGVASGAIALMVTLGITLPFFYLRIIGGGDTKLLMAASLAMAPAAVIETFLFAMIWGAVLGVCMAITHGSLRKMLTTTMHLAQRQSVADSQLHQIPFSVAILFGWLSHITAGGLL